MTSPLESTDDDLAPPQPDLGQGSFLFLGSGASSGVPVVGCKCEVCQSKDPKNTRLRPAGLVSWQGKQILIDAGPDFREQALAHSIDRLDGVIITHTHYDHIGRLDELRIFYFYQKQALPCLLSRESMDDIEHRYYYMFRDHMHGSNFTARMDWQVLEAERGDVIFQGVPIRYMSYKQGNMGVNGFRFGDFAYISDIYEYPETIFEDLAGVRKLVVGALRKSKSYVHFTTDQAVAFAQKVGAEQSWFTHISHDLDHEATNADLPPEVRMGYDGLEITFNLG